MPLIAYFVLYLMGAVFTTFIILIAEGFSGDELEITNAELFEALVAWPLSLAVIAIALTIFLAKSSAKGIYTVWREFVWRK